MNIVVDLIEALVWPVTILTLGLLFRKELRGVIGRLSQLKYKNWEARFGRGLREAEQQAKEISPTTTEPPHEILEPTEQERVFRLVEISPRAAVMEAWREVELATLRAAQVVDLPAEGRIAGSRHLRQLVEREAIPTSLVPVYEQLRHLRNQAAHAADFEIDEGEAERYVGLAFSIVRALENVDAKFDAP